MNVLKGSTRISLTTYAQNAALFVNVVFFNQMHAQHVLKDVVKLHNVGALMVYLRTKQMLAFNVSQKNVLLAYLQVQIALNVL